MFISIFEREEEEQGERDRRTERCERQTSTGCLLYIP